MADVNPNDSIHRVQDYLKHKIDQHFHDVTAQTGVSTRVGYHTVDIMNESITPSNPLFKVQIAHETMELTDEMSQLTDKLREVFGDKIQLNNADKQLGGFNVTGSSGELLEMIQDKDPKGLEQSTQRNQGRGFL